MTPSIPETLQAVNRNLESEIAGLRQNSAPTIISHGLFRLREELKRGAPFLRAFPDADFIPEAERLELEKEIGAYRCHLQQLANALPSIQGMLLAEKARLEGVGAQLAAATAWARANQGTR